MDDITTLDLAGLELLSLTNNDEVLGKGYFTGKKMLVLAGELWEKKQRTILMIVLLLSEVTNSGYIFVLKHIPCYKAKNQTNHIG